MKENESYFYLSLELYQYLGDKFLRIEDNASTKKLTNEQAKSIYFELRTLIQEKMR